VALLDGVHDPGWVEQQLRQQLPALDTLSPASQRDLLKLTGAENLQGGFPRLRGAGLLSEPLYDTKGNFVGILRLKAEPAPVRRVTEAPGARIEIYSQNHVAEQGTAALRNAAELGVGIGGTMTDTPLEDTATFGSYSTGTVTGQARVNTTTTHGQSAGGSAALARGWETGVDPQGKMWSSHVDDSDVHWTATLLGNTSSGPVEWDGLAADRQGARVRWSPVQLSAPDATVHPSAGLEHGGSAGGHTGISGFTPGNAPAGHGVDEEVEGWLREHGYLASGNDASLLQAGNYLRLLEATASDFRETNWDEFDGNGIWVPFERTTKANTIERVAVRWVLRSTVTRAQHAGATTGAKVLFGLDGNAKATASRTVGGSVGARFQPETSIGNVKKNSHVPAVPVTLPSYDHQRSYNRESPAGPTFNHNTVIESPGGEVHAFDLSRGMTAQIYSVTTNAPVWHYPPAGAFVVTE
jgi:hypothetical protein